MKALSILFFASAMVLFSGQRAIADEEGTIVVRGELFFVVCATGVKVRGDDLKTIVFQAGGYERVKPFQGWGNNKKTLVVNGKAHSLVKVQFVDNTNRGQAIGWIAEQFLKLKSQCSGAALPPVSLNGDPLKNITGLGDQRCCLFPIAERPKNNYRQHPGVFGTTRDGGRRLHAGSDLYADLYDPVRAVAPGKVVRGPIDFYMRTYQVTVKHNGGFIARYGEIAPQTRNRGRGVEVGATVKTGQPLGKVGQCINNRGRKIAPPMLHFELYTGRLGTGAELTQIGRGRFSRRADLINPTTYLEKWQRQL